MGGRIVMKQFSLEEYLANPSKKVITRDGRSARIICTDARGRFPIIALVEKDNGQTENAFAFTKNGTYLTLEQDENDLFFVSEKHERWINLFENPNPYQSYRMLQT